MVTNLAFIILIAFVIRTVRQTFFQVYLWQLKEYRIDRVIAHLKTVEGKKLVFSPLGLIKLIILFIIYGLSLISLKNILFKPPDYLIIYLFFVFWGIWIVESIKAIVDLFRKKWKVPHLTFKSFSVLTIVMFVEFFPVFSVHWLFPLLFAPMLDKLLSLLIAVSVLFLNIPFSIFKNFLNFLAYQKIKKMNIKVIGITGSYGKTSTKEFLSQILSMKYRIFKTPGSINTDIGISNYILKNLNSDFDFFLAEMGAYRKGEIKKICKIIHPEIAVITGIGNQHLELFGNTQNLIKAKFELIDSLPSDGSAFFNLNGEKNIEKMFKMAISKKINVIKTDIQSDIKNIRESKSFVYFDCKITKTWQQLKVALAGRQNLENLLLAIKIAEYLGMKTADIKSAILKITPPLHTMQIVKTSQELTIIDDTFNVNFEGIKAGIHYLANYKGKRIIFMNPIIEIGKASTQIHRQIGELAAGACDYLVVTNLNFFSDLQFGLKNSVKNKTVLLSADQKTVGIIVNGLTKDSVILFIGKESLKWMNQFLKRTE